MFSVDLVKLVNTTNKSSRKYLLTPKRERTSHKYLHETESNVPVFHLPIWAMWAQAQSHTGDLFFSPFM
jgi:hypothetical protein